MDSGAPAAPPSDAAAAPADDEHADGRSPPTAPARPPPPSHASDSAVAIAAEAAAAHAAAIASAAAAAADSGVEGNEEEASVARRSEAAAAAAVAAASEVVVRARVTAANVNDVFEALGVPPTPTVRAPCHRRSPLVGAVDGHSSGWSRSAVAGLSSRGSTPRSRAMHHRTGVDPHARVTTVARVLRQPARHCVTVARVLRRRARPCVTVTRVLLQVLSIDIDFADYWVWRAIDDARFRPAVVVVEVNSHVGAPVRRRRGGGGRPAIVDGGDRDHDDGDGEEERALELPRVAVNASAANAGDGGWDGRSDYFGASLGAFAALARAKGYAAVHCEAHGVNCFFVRNDLLRRAARRATKTFSRTARPSRASRDGPPLATRGARHDRAVDDGGADVRARRRRPRRPPRRNRRRRVPQGEAANTACGGGLESGRAGREGEHSACVEDDEEDDDAAFARFEPPCALPEALLYRPPNFYGRGWR